MNESHPQKRCRCHDRQSPHAALQPVWRVDLEEQVEQQPGKAWAVADCVETPPMLHGVSGTHCCAFEYKDLHIHGNLECVQMSPRTCTIEELIDCDLNPMECQVHQEVVEQPVSW